MKTQKEQDELANKVYTSMYYRTLQHGEIFPREYHLDKLTEFLRTIFVPGDFKKRIDYEKYQESIADDIEEEIAEDEEPIEEDIPILASHQEINEIQEDAQPEPFKETTMKTISEKHAISGKKNYPSPEEWPEELKSVAFSDYILSRHKYLLVENTYREELAKHSLLINDFLVLWINYIMGDCSKIMISRLGIMDKKVIHKSFLQLIDLTFIQESTPIPPQVFYRVTDAGVSKLNELFISLKI